jgi:hypothetical protein
VIKKKTALRRASTNMTKINREQHGTVPSFNLYFAISRDLKIHLESRKLKQ